MILKFNKDAIDSFIWVLNSITEWRIKGEWTNDGFPKDCAIAFANDDGLTVYDVEEDGAAIKNCTYQIGYDEIVSITIL